MIRLIADDVWAGLQEYLDTGERKVACIAYVGAAAAELLVLRSGDAIIVDGSDAVVSSGAVNPEVIDGWLNSRVEVRSLPGLHAKLILIESEPPIAVVGSANASAHSQLLFEAAVVASDHALCEQIREQFDVWWARSEEVGPDWVANARSIYRPPHPGTGRRRPQSKAPAAQPIWLGKSARAEVVLGTAAEAEHDRLTARYGEGRVDAWEMHDGDELQVLRGHEVVLFDVAAEGAEPHGNAAAWQPAIVVRVVKAEGEPPVAMLVYTDDTYAPHRMRFAVVRQALRDVGADLNWEAPYMPNTQAAMAIRSLWQRPITLISGGKP